jgi:hypothetical protein
LFVYRDLPASRQAGMPIDENNLSNQIHDRGIRRRPIPEGRGPVRIFGHDTSTCGGLPAFGGAEGDQGFRAEYFCLSVSPDKQKLLSVSSVPLW